MNKQRKEAAVKKYGPLQTAGATRAEVEAELKKDAKAKYTAPEIKEILEEIFKTPAAGATNPGATAPPPPPPPAASGPKKKAADEEKTGPNAELELEGFDYTKLTGKNFKQYVELVGDRNYIVFDADEGTESKVTPILPLHKNFDFECYRAQPVFKKRFAGMKDSPEDFNGIEVKNPKPEFSTRISVHQAHELNMQILNQHSRAGHGRYYLLKK